MKFDTTNELHNEILALYPDATKIVDHVIKEKKLEVGTTIINHPKVPPTTITKQMLENNFPSLEESFWWYVA